ncbi:xanthine dehydrogenase accessory protein XdhC [Cognatishimia activa]|uniref:xanthine dehydrogenase accessory protein XdhC n=1 Tax=Cognatishimia activa TaxID=1715691 RepID=UPI002E7FC244|nr:xanthine dehydrogenase accessory protein XdhC [Cognatishimia activa]
MLDLELLQNFLRDHGPYIRVVTADVQGSTPREIGAAMLVANDAQQGTIGGGTLEFEASKAALKQLRSDIAIKVSRHPLGPELGQCCGGAVTLVSECIDQDYIDALSQNPFHLRRVEGTADKPFAITRDIAKARSEGCALRARLTDGWLIEPIHQAPRKLWVWGAGHVGRAIVDVLAPLPVFSITWIDTHKDRFPAKIADGVDWVAATVPNDLVNHAPPNSEHLILTFSHSLDLSLCHALLHQGYSEIGLIGSKTKWARFQKRLSELGHSPDQISQITCPIGDPSLGKHPQEIAIGVAAKLLNKQQVYSARRDRTA